MSEKICEHCGKPIPNASSRQKYHEDCAQVVQKQQMREWYYAKKIQDPTENQRATPETVAVALGYNLENIDGWVRLACVLIADAANDYSDLCSGKRKMCELLRDRELAEIEEFFEEYGMPNICNEIKRINSK